jgi:uncharacterized glyoxalase superfamily protein PhnB
MRYPRLATLCKRSECGYLRRAHHGKLSPLGADRPGIETCSSGPQTLNGTSVRLNLLVADPDAFAERAIANGATEIATIADQSYGLRQGRLADPFGHHWLIGRPLAGESGDWARQTGH